MESVGRTNDRVSRTSHRVRRRHLLIGVGSILGAAIAGCVSDDDSQGDHDCDDPTYELDVGETVEYDGFGAYEIWAVDAEDGTVEVIRTPPESAVWDDGETVELDDEEYTVTLDDNLRLVPQTTADERVYEEGDETMAWRGWMWTVEEIDDDQATLHAVGADADHHETAVWSIDETVLVGGEMYELMVTPDDEVVLCPEGVDTK